MIHVTNKITLKRLAAIEPERPANAGKTWMPIKHSELLTAVRASAREYLNLSDADIKLDAIALSNDGASMAASFSFPSSVAWCRTRLGVLTANDRRSALRLFVGHQVGPEKVGTQPRGVLMLGEINAGRKREGRFNLHNRLHTAMVRVQELESFAGARCHKLETALVGANQCPGLLLEAARRKVVPWSRLSDVDARLSLGRIPTGLDVLLALNHEVGRSPPLTQMPQLLRATELLEEMVAKL